MDASAATGSHSRVLIVGAGPAGSAAALRLTQLGVRDITIVDAQAFPRDKTCGSGLSPRAIAVLQRLDVWSRLQPLTYPIRGIRVVTPAGREYAGAADHAVAAVLLRRVLDDELLQSARRSGARFVPRFRASEPVVDGGRWVGVRSRDGRILYADHTVVATGTHSKLALEPQAGHLIHAIMGWWDHVDFEPQHLELVFAPIVSPYYGWLFPESATRVNIGITYEDDGRPYNARQRFDRFLGEYFRSRLAGAILQGPYRGHAIAYTYRIGKLHSPGRVVVGEAGHITHPATGEGIYQAMQSACFAAEALAEVVAGRRSEASAMASYRMRCIRRFTGSLWAGGLFRWIVRTPLLDWIARGARVPAVNRFATSALAHL